jgi:hypothetical protein
MEKIMSKTNGTSTPAALEDHRPLADSELDAVSGGTDYITHSIDTPSISGGAGGGVSDGTMIAYGRAIAGAMTGR